MELVNRDVGKFKTAELILSFCDRSMKTGSAEKLSDAEIEPFLEKVPGCMYVCIYICLCVTVYLILWFSLLQTVQLFSYLNDKDMFAEIYRDQVRVLKVTSYLILT